ncbi:MAG: hypothetical protein IRD3MM_00985 [Candidatus Midichloria mitochondrii]
MGGMFQPTAFYNVGSSPHDMAVGDFNQDGSKGGVKGYSQLSLWLVHSFSVDG